MRILNRLWCDETGFVLSSEMVLVGTLGVVGATVGLNALATSVNEELEDVAFSIRSLDQSYEIAERRSAGAWTAGSSFHQEPVEKSLRELEGQIDRDERAVREHLEERDNDARQRREHEEREEREERERMEARPQLRTPAVPPSKQSPSKKPKDKDRDDDEVVL